MLETNYPECNKLESVKEESQIIGEFIEWLQSNGMSICKFTDELNQDGDWFPIRENINQILAKYFEIDLNKVEEERREMLEEIRKNNIDYHK